MDSTPNQSQASSSRRDDTEKGRQAAIAKREKEQERKAKIAAAKQAKRPLRRQEGTGHLDEAFRPLYPEEPEEVQPTYEQLQAEIAALRAENEQLKAENARLKADAERTRIREAMRRKRSRTESPPVESTSRMTIWRQAIESTHAAYARQARRYKMVDDRRQIFMLKYWFSQCLLEASRPPPDDAEEYEFWDDPAFFYDDATDE
ncbi:hypothetical protein DdX_15528 [Ditylenchus destructor]|uniref:Uncharacterized protein n=1 Tax=Ditylenchus destructor TaxID=166010 RepID=A0AAD4QUN8_9BILA|nr:hypothetical protein DdX_15528 [Ditylenchus destructor]